MYGRHVHRAVIDSGARVTGVTVHFVDEIYDRGAIIAQWPAPVFGSDTVEILSARVLALEHVLYPRVIAAVAAERVRLDDDGRVRGAFEHPRTGERFELADAPATAAAPTIDTLLTTANDSERYDRIDASA